MAGEFSKLLSEFEKFGENYGENVKALLRDPERKKVADVYTVGLTQALHGLRETLDKQYGELEPDQQADLDRTTVRHGALALLERANRYVGGGTVATTTALDDFGDVIEKIKNILARILEKLNPALAALLVTIDEIADNLKKLLGELPGQALEGVGEELKKKVEEFLEKQKEGGEKAAEGILEQAKKLLDGIKKLGGE